MKPIREMNNAANLVATYEEVFNVPPKDAITRYFGDLSVHYFPHDIPVSAIEERFNKALEILGISSAELESNPRYMYRANIKSDMQKQKKLIPGLAAEAPTPGQEDPPQQDTFSIYQLKGGNETLDHRFRSLDSIHRNGLSVDSANYELVYTALLTERDSLEGIYTRFNIDHPADFKGHSLSVSDVVVLHQAGQDTAHYVDSIGYQEVPEFLREQQELAPEACMTGEQIRTPRGNFHVTDMTRKQMEATGYGFHHQSEDGKYFIMGNGTQAFAVAAEQPEVKVEKEPFFPESLEDLISKETDNPNQRVSMDELSEEDLER